MQCRRNAIGKLLFSHLRAFTGHQWPSSCHQRSRNVYTLANHISNTALQSYISTSNDPFLNLSFEHHLLQSTPADSTVLFLYINRPCVVIGRNQNPWAEVNLHALATAVPAAAESKEQHPRPIDLVRRRSGGGTVFHDYGNVNWTVISPSSSFTRDKHVEMVVRGLRSCGIDRARVNERHDIVLDTGALVNSSRGRDGVDPHDTHRTKYTQPSPPDTNTPSNEQTVKVSGSAYKLTRGRALHHGTALVNSPHLAGQGGGLLSHLLHAPGAPYITAKGVASVRSPVANIGITPSRFIEAVRHAFETMYVDASDNKTLASQTVDDSVAEEISPIRKGMQEMKTRSWMLGQTPHFTLSLDAADAPFNLPPGTQLSLSAKHAMVTDAALIVHDGPDVGERVAKVLVGLNLAGEGRSWGDVLAQIQGLSVHQCRLIAQVADALQEIVPIGRSISL